MCTAFYAYLNGCVWQDSIPHYLIHQLQTVVEKMRGLRLMMQQKVVAIEIRVKIGHL